MAITTHSAVAKFGAIAFYAIGMYITSLTEKGKFGLTNREVSKKYTTIITPSGASIAELIVMYWYITKVLYVM